METTADELITVEAVINHWIRILGVGIDVFGVLIIVLGIVWSTKSFFYRFPRGQGAGYDKYRIQIGRSLMLGLEVLVAADIVKTVALELTFKSLGVLAGLVAIRTFLNWTLVLEIEGRWPWSSGGMAQEKSGGGTP
jgi:uncharacterized membrane protein